MFILMRFVGKLFSNDLPLGSIGFLGRSMNMASPPTYPLSYLLLVINDDLNSYRALANISIGNGATTAFWVDTLLGSETLVTSYLALFSHNNWHNVSVQYVF
jgi:hypothetical protein